MKIELLLPALLVWTALWLVGHVFLGRVLPALAAAAPAPGRIALDLGAGLLLLTPAVLAGYLLELDVSWIVGWYVLLVVGALLLRGTRRPTAPRRSSPHGASIAGLGSLLLGFDVVWGLRGGAYTSGDAPIHVARIRSLAEIGMTVHDPYIADPTPLATYHVNVVHALFALTSRIAGSEPEWVWQAGLVLAKVLVASAVGFLAHAVFRSRWIAWGALVFAAGALGTVSFLHYPNRLAGFWLLSVQLGLLVELLRGELPPREVGWALAGTALLVGFVHPFFVFVSLVGLGPVLLLWALPRLRRAPTRVPALWLSLGFASGLPLLAGSFVMPRYPRPMPASWEALRLQLGGGWSMLSPWFGVEGFGFKLALVGLPIVAGMLALVAFWRSPSARPLGVAVVLIWVSSLAYNPLLAAPLLALLPAPYMLYRFGCLLIVSSSVLAAGAFAAGLHQLGLLDGVRKSRAAALGSLLALALAGGAFGQSLLAVPSLHWQRTADFASARLQRPADQELKRVLRREVPVGAVVLAPAWEAKFVVALHPVHVVGIPLDNENKFMPDAEERDAAIRLMLDPGADPAAAIELVRRYRVGFVLLGPNASVPRWLEERGEERFRVGDHRTLFRLRAGA